MAKQRSSTKVAVMVSVPHTIQPRTRKMESRMTRKMRTRTKPMTAATMMTNVIPNITPPAKGLYTRAHVQLNVSTCCGKCEGGGMRDEG